MFLPLLDTLPGTDTLLLQGTTSLQALFSQKWFKRLCTYVEREITGNYGTRSGTHVDCTCTDCTTRWAHSHLPNQLSLIYIEKIAWSCVRLLLTVLWLVQEYSYHGVNRNGFSVNTQITSCQGPQVYFLWTPLWFQVDLSQNSADDVVHIHP